MRLLNISHVYLTRVVSYVLPIGFFFSFLIRPVRYIFFRASMTHPIIVGSFLFRVKMVYYFIQEMSGYL